MRKGVRSIARQFIGKPNEQATWNAMQTSIGAFLQNMKDAGHLREYIAPVVYATDSQVVDGRTSVYLRIKPTIETEYIDVYVTLE